MFAFGSVCVLKGLLRPHPEHDELPPSVQPPEGSIPQEGSIVYVGRRSSIYCSFFWSAESLAKARQSLPETRRLQAGLVIWLTSWLNTMFFSESTVTSLLPTSPQEHLAVRSLWKTLSSLAQIGVPTGKCIFYPLQSGGTGRSLLLNKHSTLGMADGI